jgi:hypothetical protein
MLLIHNYILFIKTPHGRNYKWTHYAPHDYSMQSHLTNQIPHPNHEQNALQWNHPKIV